MDVLIKNAQDFLDACLALYPPGRVWDKDPDSNMTLALQSLMQNQARVFNDASNLLIDAFPATSVNLLPQWEQSLGLPDSCLGANPSIAQRQQQVVARLTDTGGQSLVYYVDYAKALGYEISITVFRPQLVGVDKVGHFRMFPTQSAFWVEINAQPAASLNTVLECEFEARKRVTTTLFFNYTYGTLQNATIVGTNVSTYDPFDNATQPISTPIGVSIGDGVITSPTVTENWNSGTWNDGRTWLPSNAAWDAGTWDTTNATWPLEADEWDNGAVWDVANSIWPIEPGTWDSGLQWDVPSEDWTP